MLQMGKEAASDRAARKAAESSVASLRAQLDSLKNANETSRVEAEAALKTLTSEYEAAKATRAAAGAGVCECQGTGGKGVHVDLPGGLHNLQGSSIPCAQT